MTTFIETLNQWGDHCLKLAWPMLWQSSLLITVIFVLEFALRRKIRAAIRYALWLVVLVKLLLPPSLALPTSPTWWIHPAAPPPVKSPPVSFTVTYGEQVAPSFPLPPPPVIPPPRAPAMSFAAWILAAAGVISAGLLAWLLVRWRQINRTVRRATASEKLTPVLDETRRLTHLRPGIRLKLTEDSLSPAVCGLFRPVILLPQSLVERLSDAQLRAVLLHEAIHLRRGDVWVNCAQALLQIVYWWHPLLWLANARIRRVREEAVDDAVMLALRDDAEIYAPTLLEVAKLAFNRPLASLGLVGILESRSALRQRIERLVNFNAPRKAGLTVASILGILAFSAVALPMGEAPEKTNAPAPVAQPFDNGPTATNVVEGKLEADKLVRDGKLLYEKGNYLEAETNLNRALKSDPNNQGAFYYLSLVKQANYARKEQNGTNSVADSRVQVPNAWSPKLDFGLPVANPHATNTGNSRQNIEITGGSVEFDGTTGIMTATNTVVVKDGNSVFTADSARINRKSGEMTLEGHVHVQSEKQIFTAGGMTYKLALNTNRNAVESYISETNFRVVLHALEQRTGVQSLAEPEPVTTGGGQVQHMSANYILQQPQYTGVTNNDIHTGAGREMILSKLNSLRLESISWSNGLPLNEVIRFLAEQSRLRDPDKKGINFMFNPNVGASPVTGGPRAGAGASGLLNPTTGLPETSAADAAPKTVDVSAISIKLTLNNTSLHDVLNAVVQSADRPIKYSVEDWGVVISAKPPGPEPPVLETRVFKIDTNKFTAGNLMASISRNEHVKLDTNSVSSLAISFFSAIGVNLNATDRAFVFNDKLGLLIVKATPSELDTVERVIQKLNEASWQIHIKARFIEVPESEVGAILQAGTAVDTSTVEILKAGTAVSTNTVEILAADKMKSLLRQLASAGGVAALAEPEAVTAHAHQVQMRSDITTVDLVPTLLNDGYTLNLQALVSKPETGLARVNIWDGQTLAIVFPGSDGKSRLVVFITPTIVDPAGNRVHSDDALRLMQEKAKRYIPPQDTSNLPDPNSRATLHALDQRTVVGSFPVTPAEQGTNRINRTFVPDRMDIPTMTTNALEAGMLIQTGKLLYEMGKFEEASVKLNQALKLDPNNQGALYYSNLIKQAINHRKEVNQAAGAGDATAEVRKVWAPKVGYGLPVPNPYAVNTNVHPSATNDPNSTQLEMRSFKVDTNAFAAGLRGIQNLQANDVVTMAKSLFSQLGVDLSAPGRSIAINDGLGLLFVKATRSELDTVERVIQTMNQIPPQIHIKARFIEVEQDNNPARGFDWFLGSFSNGPVVANGRGALSSAVPTSAANPLGSFPGNTRTNAMPATATDQQLTSGLRNTASAPATVTGILTDPNFRVTLHALESRPRTKILAEPEAVTISGRQTQMRVTDINAVLTGINPRALKPPGVSSNELFLTEQVECGPVFDVVPIVLSDGYTLNLTTTASVTEFLGYDKATNSATVYLDGKKQTVPVPLPKLRTQRISSAANLWDGQTLVLGGAATSAVQITKDKVPLLGNLPLLGGLFRSQTENPVKKQLMVFVTATIVDQAGNRWHSDDELPFKPNTIPPQPQLSTPSR
jgi:type II secretory pathway component GspD/PulD (secretin)/beta-lactamase regulating signal transducer with metallopeptidase domain